MAFIKRDVKDRVVQYPRRYQLVEVSQGIYDLVPVTGTVTEEGTAINKAYLQPIEDGLDAALEKTGDGKDVIVTFTEAATEAHIASGEKLSTLFGKILKKFKNVAPTSHASTATTYGVGTTANYGHCKTINGLTQASHVNGLALSAYQGKVLKDLVDLANPAKVFYTGYAVVDSQKTVCTFDITKYKNVILKASYSAKLDILNNTKVLNMSQDVGTGGMLINLLTLNSTLQDITYRGTSGNVLLMSVSGNTATIKVEGIGSGKSMYYEVILF